ncbi:MAG: YfhO family protein [Muribaculaceae bacterium]|nr:YfhO family protein [Muribaculaceae bacterium]
MKSGQIDVSVKLDSLSNQRKNKTVSNFMGTSEGFTCNSDFSNPEVVFFSVVADPGFSAYIDGKPTKIYEVNLGLSAIIVPEGKHDIKFSYLPQGLKVGGFISLISLLILMLVGYYSGERQTQCQKTHH